MLVAQFTNHKSDVMELKLKMLGVGALDPDDQGQEDDIHRRHDGTVESPLEHLADVDCI